MELIRRDYVANGGWETFLSYEDPKQGEKLSQKSTKRLEIHVAISLVYAIIFIDLAMMICAPEWLKGCSRPHSLPFRHVGVAGRCYCTGAI